MIVFASMILEAWKFDSEPIENQLEFEAPDFWLTLERADVAERTERPDSELIEDKAEIEKNKFMILMSHYLYRYKICQIFFNMHWMISTMQVGKTFSQFGTADT